jgi:bifunctional DNA-binding transcriptional regulator/antitoxin component of YhaV-PrlF toxin-antitoxin module
MGIKVKVVVDPGDAKAELKVKSAPDVEEEAVSTSGAPAEREYELDLGDKLEVTVDKIWIAKYDPDQLRSTHVERTEEDLKKEKEEKEKAAREAKEKEREAAAKSAPKSGGTSHGTSHTGAKEAANETHETGPRSTRR